VSLSEAELLDDVRQRLFAPNRSATPRAIGLELELIPVHRSTRTRALATNDPRISTTQVLSRLGKRQGWNEQSIESDPPSWTTVEGARISFEPGGQLEISTAPHPTASAVIDATQSLVSMLRDATSEAGIDLLARGVDPYSDINAVPLQLHRERYAGMTRYFDSVGPSGIRMMRQTAALQINLERGEEPESRWRLLNALAPIVVALFANSPEYAGARTHWVSYRAQLWRTLDHSRTGIIYDEDRHIQRYLDFALDAIAMRPSADGRGYRSFRQWARDPAVGREDWLFHLSTLFPEVRPKDFFELRSADTIEPDALPAPVVFVTGLVYDAESARHGIDLLGQPSTQLLERAGQVGLADAEIHRLASMLSTDSLNGARRLGEDYVRASHVAAAEAYFARALSGHDI
jgi:glutamate--cysteine ligase